MRYSLLGLAAALLLSLVNLGTNQEKVKDDAKLDAIKVDLSLIEKTWDVKITDAAIWKQTLLEKYLYDLRFTMRFNRDLQPNELTALRELFVKKISKTVPAPLANSASQFRKPPETKESVETKMWIYFFDKEMFSTGKISLPAETTMLGDLSGVKGDGVKISIRLEGNNRMWENSTLVVARPTQPAAPPPPKY